MPLGRLPGRALPFVFCVLSLAGCAYQLHHVTQSKAGAPLDRSEPSPDLLRVVTTGNVDRPYKQLGMVHAPASLTERDAITALKRRARTLGGDALLDVRRRGSDAADAGGSSGPAEAPWEAAVIVFTDRQAGGSPTAPPSAPPRREPP
ncbi:MAG TPA: hypothetical protein VMW75_24950 [Thermoanaerobaculia bacterium]|nr:hypothetical protein [Thermoanaerobaculia bacterium]